MPMKRSISDDRPVQHHRRPAAVVFGDVLGAQPSRHLNPCIVPHCHRGDRVLQRVLDLRPVERPVAR
jgi:hypothetical protein